jgi:hypothetical protein
VVEVVPDRRTLVLRHGRTITVRVWLPGLDAGTVKVGAKVVVSGLIKDIRGDDLVVVVDDEAAGTTS